MVVKGLRPFKALDGAVMENFRESKQELVALL
jgi:hypothetical protein